MDKNLDNIMNTLKQLSGEDKTRILFFLEQERQKNLTPKEQKIVSYFTEETKKLEKWNQEVDELLKDTRKFFDELNTTV